MKSDKDLQHELACLLDSAIDIILNWIPATASGALWKAKFLQQARAAVDLHLKQQEKDRKK